MRELKFRAWKKSENKMIQWYELQINPLLVDILCGIYLESVMQYTGLKDSTGEDIYEGDILFSKLSNNRYEVIFCDGEYRGDQHSFCMSPCFFKDTKIIGNIYENTELKELFK